MCEAEFGKSTDSKHLCRKLMGQIKIPKASTNNDLTTEAITLKDLDKEKESKKHRNNATIYPKKCGSLHSNFVLKEPYQKFGRNFNISRGRFPRIKSCFLCKCSTKEVRGD